MRPAALALVCLLVAPAASAPAAPRCTGPQLACEINELRFEHGLGSLRPNAKLAMVALALAQDMARTQNFSHVDSHGRDLNARVASVGYLARRRGGAVSENIAWAQGPLATPLSIAGIWMASDEHRQKMLDPTITEIGVATASDGAGGAYFVADFGAPGAPRATKAKHRRSRHRHRSVVR
jgi:uncharacterized protein YkwD